MPALPVLGAAAKFLMANGARAATMKFGKAAVDKAKDQIKKRDSAISDKASTANIGVKRTQKPESTRKMQDTKRDKKMAKEEIVGRSGKSDLLRPPKDEMPLKFTKGGMKKMMGGGMMKSKMSTKGGAMGGKKKMAPGMKKGGKFPDLTGDGKVTKKDVLKGRGVPGFKEGGKKVSKGYAKGGMKMKSKMTTKGGAKGGGYKKGGKVRGAGIARKGVRPVKYR